MTVRDYIIYKEDKNISIKGTRLPNPLIHWDDNNIISKTLQLAIKRNNYDNPTPIQSATIPLGYNQRDLIAISPTGTGKTVAYLLPIINFIMNKSTLDTSVNGPYGLILLPTRDLANQICNIFNKLKPLKTCIKCVCVIGGKDDDIQ